jgi:hypothetical protein
MQSAIERVAPQEEVHVVFEREADAAVHLNAILQ